MIHRIRQHLARHRHIWLIAVVSYVPLLVTRRGTLNADTKLYLGEDVANLMKRSLFAWDPSQFGGFIPHQSIAYLWPSGPFYWVTDFLGAPQWLSQRMWVATLFFVASAGAFVLLRTLQFSPTASLVAGLTVQFSPYVLPYQSRTSSMLLPWAGIFWLCFFVYRGTRESSWRWPALISLTMMTIGAVNATATLLILPAPILFALHGAWHNGRLRHLITFALRAGLLTCGTSLWWITMLMIQGRYGADVLRYTETLEAVSSTSHAFEVIRGFGYWLNYVGLDALPLTSATKEIITSPMALVATTAVPALALLALALVKHTYRAISLWLIVVGVVVAVGVYPLDDPAPIFQSLATNPTSSLSLALRSSTRAFPVALVGLTIGLAILCDASLWNRLSQRVRSQSGIATSLLTYRHNFPIALIVLIVVGSHPTRLVDGVIDPTLARKPIPASWRSFGDMVDTQFPGTHRIMQLPGQEFGAYTWGYTIDPALPAVTSASVLTRDLIPLGDEPLMNFVWAIDEAAREGRLHKDALATIAALTSTQTIYLPGDLNNQRDRTPTQELLLTSNAIGDVAVQQNAPTGPHRYITYTSADHSFVRQLSGSTLLLGDGKGIVDAAIASNTSLNAILLAGSITDPEFPTISDSFANVVVTDTNTERAQHWRDSIDTNGFDENRDGDLANLGSDRSDIRMRIFSKQRDDDVTWFEQVGPVRARASSYGPPLLYRPEYRPFSAIDNDPDTAWTVADGVTALSPVLLLTTQEPISQIRILQPQGPRNRTIATVSISVDDQTWETADLTNESRAGGQTIALSSPGTTIAIRIDETTITEGTPVGEELDAVGFAEISTGLSPTREVGVLPTRGLDYVTETTPLSYVMTRRVAPLGRVERRDIETQWSRSFFLPMRRQMQMRLRIDTTEKSSTQRDDIVQILQSTSPLNIDGNALRISDVALSDHDIVATVQLGDVLSGPHVVETNSSTVTIDQIIVETVDTTPTETTLLAPMSDISRTSIKVVAQPCPTGCWLVVGQGRNKAWQATNNGVSLGTPRSINGGMQGWWLAPNSSPSDVEVKFIAQSQLTFALIATLLSAVLSLLVAIRSRKSEIRSMQTRADVSNVLSTVMPHVVTFATFLALFGWSMSVLTTVAGAVIHRVHHTDNSVRIGGVMVLTILTSSLWALLRSDTLLDFSWPARTSGSHQALIFVITAVACLSLYPDHSRNNKVGLHKP